jgi:hypothetical protein
MHLEKLITIAAVAALMVSACGSPEPAREPAREEPTSESAEAVRQRAREDDTAQLEKRVADLERRWTEMQSKVAAKTAAPAKAMMADVDEDMKSIRQAVADLKTTTPENWWERHERAVNRAFEDVEEDVRRFAKGKRPAAAPTEPDATGAPGPLESRRDTFVARMRARVDAMEEQLKGVRAQNAQETQLDDLRARIDKLRNDLERLGKASAADWWDISSRRVTEYIDRLEKSVARLDNDTK